MITCHLTKLETAVEQIKKSNPKMKPTDAALVASALVLTGRHAIALYGGEQYRWPEDYEQLTQRMSGEVDIINESIEPVKKTKSAPEEEPVTIPIGLMPNFSAGERLLENRKDLKAKLSDVLAEGVEFQYSPTDLGWQWALDRANWATISGKEVQRRIKVKATFTEGAVGVEVGTTTKKRSSKKEAAPVVEVEPVEELAVVDLADEPLVEEIALEAEAGLDEIEADAPEAKPKAAKAKAKPAKS